MTRYLIVAQGAGEYQLDYDIMEYNAESPQEAADKAVSDGYAQTGRDAKLFVARMDWVTQFVVSERPTAYEATKEESVRVR